jgi:hypothetical protein
LPSDFISQPCDEFLMLEGLAGVRTDNSVSHLWHDDDDLLIFGEISDVLTGGPMDSENTWLVYCTVSASMSCDKLWGAALLITIGW